MQYGQKSIPGQYEHELRTPMIGILGAVELLEQSRLELEQSQKINIIKDCAEQLLKIINEILDVSKIELGMISLNPEPCNIPELICHTLNIIEPLAKIKGLELKLNITGCVPNRLLLDSIRMRQVLLNLLHNAIKFTRYGKIQVLVDFDNDTTSPCLQVSVSDTGMGIPPDQIERIFEPFNQVDNTFSRKFGGTGLGLYLCKKLVESMGGRIWHNSNEQKEGAVFSFYIPVGLDSNKQECRDEVSQNSSKNYSNNVIDFKPVQILIVEDNELNQKIVAQILENFGFEVQACANGLECLRILQDYHFDLVLMDMQMPIMDGYETTALIRQDPELKNIPVIAMTAHAMSGDREKCLACGCTSYLAKPFKADELVEEIRKHLETSSSLSKPSQSSQQLISQLLPELKSNLLELISDLAAAVEFRNFERIKSISHDLKGSAGIYGFMELSKTASLIEELARSEAYTDLPALIERLIKDFDDAEIAL